MATINKFPPEMPKDWDETQDGGTISGLRARAANAAGEASDAVKGGFQRVRESVAEIDPVESAREAGGAVVEAVERHPLAIFGLGALSVGLIAWAGLRRPAPAWEPAAGNLRQWFNDYGGPEAVRAGDRALKQGQSWFADNSDVARGYSDAARAYALDGGRYLARRGEKEPLAAVLGIGLALYVVGSLLTSSRPAAPAPRKRAAPKSR